MKKVFLTILFSFLVWSAIAWKVWTFTASGSTGSTTGNDKTGATTWVKAYGAAQSAGYLYIITIGLDNLGTADGDNGDVISVTDNASNTYTKAGEFSNAQGAAAAGATVSVWYCILTNAVTTSNNITVTFNGSPVAKGMEALRFGITGGNTISISTIGTLANDAADVGSITLSSLTSREYLFVRATAMELTTMTTTVSTNYSKPFNPVGTTGAGSTTNIQAYMEYRILTATTDVTDPTNSATSDAASIMIPFYEVTPGAPTNKPKFFLITKK